MTAEGRITHHRLGSLRHASRRLPPGAPARRGSSSRRYWRAYREFYRWASIVRGAAAHDSLLAGLRHFAYAAGWKKFEPLWDLVIRARQAGAMLPVLEAILSEFGRRTSPSFPVPYRIARKPELSFLVGVVFSGAVSRRGRDRFVNRR